MAHPVTRIVYAKFTLVDDERKFVKLNRMYGRPISYTVTRDRGAGIYDTAGGDFTEGFHLEVAGGGAVVGNVSANIAAGSYSIQGNIVGSLNVGDPLGMNAGAGYNTGTHTNVTFSGDAYGIRATVVVDGDGEVTSCIITNAGTNKIIDTVANGGMLPLVIDDNSGSPGIGVGSPQSDTNLIPTAGRTYNPVSGNNVYMFFDGTMGETHEVIVKIYIH